MSEIEEDPALWLRRFALSAGPRLSAKECRFMMQAAELIVQTTLTRDALAGMLDQLANIIKGEPEPDSVWGFDDLPELVQGLVDRDRRQVH